MVGFFTLAQQCKGFPPGMGVDHPVPKFLVFILINFYLVPSLKLSPSHTSSVCMLPPITSVVVNLALSSCLFSVVVNISKFCY